MALDRRTFLQHGLLAGGGATILGGLSPTAGHAAPALVRTGRPQLTHGVQSGDVSVHDAIVWARADRPSRMLVDVSTRPDLAGARTIKGPVLTPETDLTGKTPLHGLPAGRQLHYRVRLTDLRDSSLASEPATGRFKTAPSRHQDVRFLWSGDLAGQGWGINPDLGGYRIFTAMAALNPDFFLCSGDLVYSDGPLAASVPLPDGRTWRNLTTPEKSKVAESLAEFRGQFRYNLMDQNLRAFNAAVSMVYQWDDHETRNNWFPGQIIDDARYTEKRADVLAQRARRAAFEYTPIAIRPPAGGGNRGVAPPGQHSGRIYRKIGYGPLLEVFVLDMRTYKEPNGPNNSPTQRDGLLGKTQTEWLKRGLRESKATWKIIANDLPLGLIVPDGTAFEAAAQGDNGAPLGREREIADLLSYVHRHRIANLVWLTTDVHYTSAIYYDPAKAAFKDFTPFWEFVSGPLNAGAFGPNKLDSTFGADVRFAKAPPRANTSPAEGYQFFSEVAINAASRAMTVRLRDQTGGTVYAVDLLP